VSTRTFVGLRCVVFMIALVCVVSACSGGAPTRSAGAPLPPELVPASKALLAECRRAADEVGYPAPCPLQVPPGLYPTAKVGGCRLGIVGAGGIGGCSHAWRHWIVGSSETPEQHLVIAVSPRPLRAPAKVVNGPAWYPGARVRLLGRMTINGWRARSAYVPPETNDGSAFARHVVMIWTAGRHTYAVGFHNVEGIRRTLALDVALVRAIRLVPPRRGA
jgi:hypothetical protein